MLTDRELLILEEIVREYTENGQPIGSKTLMNNLPFKVSSATIRNDMAKLEDAGLLEKMHSSSGRVPSLTGYRYYVDHLLRPSKINDQQVKTIAEGFDTHFQEVDDIVKTSADMLSKITHYTALTLKPEQHNTTITGFRMVRISESQIMILLVDSNGDVTSQQFTIPHGMDSNEIERVLRIMNDRLIGKTFDDVETELKGEIPRIIEQTLYNGQGFIDVFDNIINRSFEDRYFVSGKLNMLNFSNVSDISSIKALLGMFNKQDELDNLLIHSRNQGVNVKIGNELSNSLLKDFSLITTTYDVGNRGTGIIAILGPTSMEYSKTLGLLDTFRNQLSHRMLQYYKHLNDS